MILTEEHKDKKGREGSTGKEFVLFLREGMETFIYMYLQGGDSKDKEISQRDGENGKIKGNSPRGREREGEREREVE